MADFYKKELKISKTLGERLKKTREEAGITLEEVSAATRIKKEYLKAIEESNYFLLPGTVYVRNFLKKYATFLEVSPSVVLDLYEKEEKIIEPIREKRNLKKIQGKAMPKSLITPKVLRNAIILLVILALLGYVGLEIKRITSSPKLIITSPANNLVTKERSIEIVGQSEPESKITINNQEIFIDPNGQFKSTLELKEGVNTIKITAQKKRSKESIVYLNILVEAPPQ